MRRGKHLLFSGKNVMGWGVVSTLTVVQWLRAILGDTPSPPLKRERRVSEREGRKKIPKGTFLGVPGQGGSCVWCVLQSWRWPFSQNLPGPLHSGDSVRG